MRRNEPLDSYCQTEQVHFKLTCCQTTRISNSCHKSIWSLRKNQPRIYRQSFANVTVNRYHTGKWYHFWISFMKFLQSPKISSYIFIFGILLLFTCSAVRQRFEQWRACLFWTVLNNEFKWYLLMGYCTIKRFTKRGEILYR